MGSIRCLTPNIEIKGSPPDDPIRTFFRPIFSTLFGFENFELFATYAASGELPDFPSAIPVVDFVVLHDFVLPSSFNKIILLLEKYRNKNFFKRLGV